MSAFKAVVFAEMADKHLDVSKIYYELRKSQSKTALEFVLNLRTLKDGM